MPQRFRSLALFLLAFALFSTAAAWQSAVKDDPSQRIAPLREQGPRYWKGNLHTHSLWSDGDDFPEMIADWYKRNDYHFLSLTDHNILSEGERWIDIESGKTNRTVALKKYQARFGDRWVQTRQTKGKEQVRLKPLAEFRNHLEEPGRFLMIPGEEITHKFAKSPVHMNGINLRDVIKPIDGANVQETIQVNLRQVAEQRQKTGWRNLGFLNHPNFGWGVRAEDMMGADEMQYFEVFNGHPGVRNYGDETHAGTERMWDILLAVRLGKLRLPVVYGLATDDAHGYHAYGIGKVNPGRGWVMVRADFLTAEAIVQAMEKGDFYFSSGTLLKEIRHENNIFRVAIQAEKGVTYKTRFFATMKDAPLTSKAVVDDKGNPLPVTGIFSPEVGKLVGESESLEASYQFTGKELYVRAKVTSSKLHPNPYQKGDVEVAWTQPMVP